MTSHRARIYSCRNSMLTTLERPQSSSWLFLSLMVRAGCVCVGIIHRTLTWTTGSLSFAQMLMREIVHRAVRTPKESLHWKLTLGRKCLAAPGNRTCVSQLSYIPSPTTITYRFRSEVTYCLLTAIVRGFFVCVWFVCVGVCFLFLWVFFFFNLFCFMEWALRSEGFEMAQKRTHFYFYFLICRFSLIRPALRREAGDIWCLPPVWNLRAVIWFHFAISSLVLLPNPVTLSVWSFSACWPFLLNFFQKMFQYFSSRDRLFCMAPV